MSRANPKPQLSAFGSPPMPLIASTAHASGTSGTVVSIAAAKKPITPTVIAVTSGKGGVGKTNVSVNLAIALGRTGARVLCVDADLGLANMDIVMGLAPTHTTADLIRGQAEIDDVLVRGPDNVWLLPGASGQYDLANLSDAQRHQFFAAIDTLDDRFDIVIVDTGAGVGSNSVGFASAARDIVVVVTAEPTSVADAYGMIKVLNTRCGVHRVKVLVNSVRSPTEGEQVFRRLTSLTERFLNIGVDYLGYVPFDPMVSKSVMRGEPFMSTHPDCHAARAISQVAERLRVSEDTDDRQGAIRLFWRKLLRQGAE